MQDKTPFSAISDAFSVHPENMINETYFPAIFMYLYQLCVTYKL
jgi:hypothetical protein